jgi:ubiquinone/menaquinone biosynthesis C-methylase UbiE
MSVNAQYNEAAPDSLAVKVAGYQRRKMFEAFLEATDIKITDTLLDVGATSDQDYHHSNYVEAWYPHKSNVTAVGTDDATFLEDLYPGMKFVQADGRDLPFEDGSFDIVHSSAVLEHVGDKAMQTQFLREMWRVARKRIFITTPNRYFPVEFHTVLPFVHWLPSRTFRKILGRLGKDFFSDVNNLNLMSAKTLRKAAHRAGITNFSIKTVSLAGWPTNLMLTAEKDQT